MKPNHFHAPAVALYDGNGAPRYREGIIRDIQVALENAYAQGVIDGAAQVRESTIREALAIAVGMEQQCTSRRGQLERELADHQSRRKPGG